MRVLLAALLSLGLIACTPPQTPTQTAEPALWRIADADSEIWLFGSVHMLPPDLQWRGPRVSAAFAAAEELVTETDLPSPESSRAFAAFIERHGYLGAGESLARRVGAAEAARATDLARELGLAPTAIERQRPWLSAIQLSHADLVRAGQSAEAGVETVLAAEARRRGMRLGTLETIEAQLGVLAGLAPEDEARFFTVTLREIGQSQELVDQMDRAWAAGDIATLERLFDQQWRDAGPGIHDAVILRRNRAWADEIERRLDGSGKLFIAVGAAHLIGRGSVVDLLRQRGVAVEGP